MKKLTPIIFIVALAGALSSCATAISVGKVQEYKLTVTNPEPVMDFIGYKIDTSLVPTVSDSSAEGDEWTANTNTVMVMPTVDQAQAVTITKGLGNLGQNLESVKLANNKTHSFLGNFSLQELELYKGDSRYVTFVEVAKNDFKYRDNGATKLPFGLSGAGLAATSVGFLGGAISAAGQESSYSSGGYLYVYYDNRKIAFSILSALSAGGAVPFLIAAFKSSKTKVSFDGAYNVYVYDTQAKSLIAKDTVSLTWKKTFKGSYMYDKESKDALEDYVGQEIYNVLVKKYDELNRWLKNRK
ncbi:MAG: hypothetical protein J1F14_05195 [Treponema sp.]|nr:hypothetical protein [Treponema sp.]